MVAALAAGLGAPARAENDGRADTSAPDASGVTGASPALSLEAVTERLNAQEQEIALLREALREQQQLTASLEAKLSASAPMPIASAASPITVPPNAASPAGPQSQDLSPKVAALQTQLDADRSNFEQRLKHFGPGVIWAGPPPQSGRHPLGAVYLCHGGITPLFSG